MALVLRSANRWRIPFGPCGGMVLAPDTMRLCLRSEHPIYGEKDSQTCKKIALDNLLKNVDIYKPQNGRLGDLINWRTLISSLRAVFPRFSGFLIDSNYNSTNYICMSQSCQTDALCIT